MNETELVVRLDQTEHEIKILIDSPDTELPVMMLAQRGSDGPAGRDGAGAGNSIVGEIPLGAINGINAVFTTANNFIPESVSVFLNGLNQKRISEFNTSGTNTIVVAESPNPGEIILVNYLKGE